MMKVQHHGDGRSTTLPNMQFSLRSYMTIISTSYILNIQNLVNQGNTLNVKYKFSSIIHQRNKKIPYDKSCRRPNGDSYGKKLDSSIKIIKSYRYLVNIRQKKIHHWTTKHTRNIGGSCWVVDATRMSFASSLRRIIRPTKSDL